MCCPQIYLLSDATDSGHKQREIQRKSKWIWDPSEGQFVLTNTSNLILTKFGCLIFFQYPDRHLFFFWASAMIFHSVHSGRNGPGWPEQLLTDGFFYLDGWIWYLVSKIGHILNSTMVAGLKTRWLHPFANFKFIPGQNLWRVQEGLDVNNILFLRVSTEIHHRPRLSLYIIRV